MCSDEIFESSSKPELLGADVQTLYPSLCPLGTADIAAEAVRNSKVSFKGIDFKFLIIYLFLIIGVGGLRSLGLNAFIPMRKDRKCKSMSLIGKKNRTMDNWHVETDQLSDENKIEMVAAMVKISTLVLMKSTCYSFRAVFIYNVMVLVLDCAQVLR